MMATNIFLDIFLTIKKNRNKIAIIFENQRITYKDLGNAAAYYKDKLIELGVKPGDRIILDSNKNIHTVSKILGIIYAGCTYVPVDFDYNEIVIGDKINLIKPKVIISDNKVTEKFSLPKLSHIEIGYRDNEYENLYNPQYLAKNKLAYILFTSGSTGMPKAVIISKKNLNNLILTFIMNLDKSFCPKIIGYSNLIFDLSILDIFTFLILGGQYYIPSKEKLKSASYIFTFIKNNDINFFQTVPTIWIYFLDYLDNLNLIQAQNLVLSLKKIILAGEQLYSSLIAKWFSYACEGCTVFNMYGPTETIHVTIKSFDKANVKKYQDILPIGQALRNNKIELMSLDENSNQGEIIIIGENVGEGYWENKTLTNERFFKRSTANGKLERAYRTGDIGKIINGELFFVGRRDQIVKFDGKALDLSRVENFLNNYPEVKNSVYLCLSGKDLKSKKILVLEGDKTKIDPLKIRKVLKENFEPAYFPNLIKVIEKLPQNSNGKIDRIALKNRLEKNIDPISLYHLEKESVVNGGFIEHPQINILINYEINFEDFSNFLQEEIEQPLTYNTGFAETDLKKKKQSKATSLFVNDELKEIIKKEIFDFSLINISIQKKFNLRLNQISNKPDIYLVMFRGHHSVFDGSSLNIFFLNALNNYLNKKMISINIQSLSIIKYQHKSLNNISKIIDNCFYKFSMNLYNEYREFIRFDDLVTDLVQVKAKINNVSEGIFIISVIVLAIKNSFPNMLKSVEMPVLAVGEHNSKRAIIKYEVIDDKQITSLASSVKFTKKFFFGESRRISDSQMKIHLNVTFLPNSNFSEKVFILPLDFYENLYELKFKHDIVIQVFVLKPVVYLMIRTGIPKISKIFLQNLNDVLDNELNDKIN